MYACRFYQSKTINLTINLTMPSKFVKFKRIFYKPIKEEKFNKMIFNVADSSNPGFSYLKFFKPEVQSEVASLLGEAPTVKEVCTLVLQNLDREQELLTTCKIKLVRYDETQVFFTELECDTEEGWVDSREDSEWFKPKAALFFIGRNFKYYKFM
jgi:hypothetical protein